MQSPPSSVEPTPQEWACTRGDLAGQLHERVKELTCLYEVAAAFVEHRTSLRDCTSRVVNVLPGACQVPARAVARMRLDELVVASPGSAGDGYAIDAHPGTWITSDLVVAGVRRGDVTLAYTATPPHAVRAGIGNDADPSFLPEERALLQTVARQVGVFVESVEAEQRRTHMESQLRHADRLATIGQLAAGVAHELNEPLGNTLGFAQLALKAPGVPEQVRADLGRIVQASLHGREIIRKLLVFARQAPASKHPISVNAVVDEAMFLLEAGCENPGIRFARDVAADLPAIEADPVQVRQVVTNLVINAMQAIAGKGTITIRTRAQGDAIVLTVEDDGAGMTPEVLRRAFDPFFTTKDVGEGTGLGLAVVQGIVAGHGGRVEVTSEPSRGSTFRVLLPIHPAPMPERGSSP